MKKITKEEFKVAEKCGLIYNGEKHIPKTLHPSIKTYDGRNFITTKHSIFVTDGYKGIYDILQKILIKRQNQPQVRKIDPQQT